MASSELLRKLKEAISGKAEDVPPGWFTAVELSKSFRKSSSHTGKLIKSGLEAGVLERRIFRIETDQRGVFPTWHYRETKRSEGS
jgi:hypothetical protein